MGAPILALSLTPSLAFFYLFYCTARMSFAGPYDLGIYGSIVSWFVRRRSFATSVATLAQMAGLVAMPLIAHAAMTVLVGAALGAIGTVMTGLSQDLKAIVIGFATASLGFGLFRPGFTAGASLSVPRRDQGAVAGKIGSASCRDRVCQYV